MSQRGGWSARVIAPSARRSVAPLHRTPVSKSSLCAYPRVLPRLRRITAIRLTPHLRSLLPAWYHISADPHPITNVASICLLNNHAITKVADLIQMSNRLHDPPPQNLTHLYSLQCICQHCVRDRLKECKNPHACATEAQTRIEGIASKLNPMQPSDNHDGLSLIRSCKTYNETAKRNKGAIMFDPTIICKKDLSECF